jgi:hypothetical protein
MGILNTGFWNLCNLFPARLVERGPQSQKELNAKLDALASAVSSFFSDGIDILGVCELSSESLLKTLSERIMGNVDFSFEGAHAPDQTGIGVLFNRSKIKVLKRIGVQRPTLEARPRCVVYECQLVGRRPGAPGALFNFAVNHWKSRMVKGTEDTDLDRQGSARWLADFLRQHQRTPASIIMGDFNAEPVERVFTSDGLPIEKYFNSVKYWRTRVIRFYSPMWRFLPEPAYWEQTQLENYQEPRPKTSHGKQNVLFDHLIISPAALLGPELRIREASVRYFTTHGVGTWSNTGLLRPSPWVYDTDTGMGGGFSDHFPILAEFEY